MVQLLDQPEVFAHFFHLAAAVRQFQRQRLERHLDAPHLVQAAINDPLRFLKPQPSLAC
jgi:hypothetical protein